MKIIAFSNGDSNKTATWSNVPYFFLKAMERVDGVTVIRVNIRPLEPLTKLTALLNLILFRLHTGLCFERTALHKTLVKRKMRRTVQKHPDADLLISFDFSNSIADETNIKTLLLCDWDIQYLIKHIEKRAPLPAERRQIAAQKKIIDGADYAVSIFPNAFEEMKKEHSNLYFFGTPVNLEAPAFDIAAAVSARYQSKRLLFIGKTKYLSGAKALAEGIEAYNQKHEQKLLLDIIGMTEKETGIHSRFITHHGYLNKDNPGEWQIYSGLLQNAFFFINTTDQWVGASSILDTAYLGIPCMIQPNPDIIKTFGETIDFGYYCYENTGSAIEAALRRITELSPEEYRAMSRNAKSAVEGFTYPVFVQNIINLVNGGASHA